MLKERAYVGMIIYPINGRAAGVTPLGHFSFNRKEIIATLSDEIREQEPQYAEVGLKLLETKDVVRIGRIIVEIMDYPRDISTEGVEAI